MRRCVARRDVSSHSYSLRPGEKRWEDRSVTRFISFVRQLVFFNVHTYHSFTGLLLPPLLLLLPAAVTSGLVGARPGKP